MPLGWCCFADAALRQPFSPYDLWSRQLFPVFCLCNRFMAFWYVWGLQPWFAWYYYYSVVLRNWFITCFNLYLGFPLLYLLPHNAQKHSLIENLQPVQLNRTLINSVEHEVFFATSCSFGCNFKQLAFFLSKCQRSIFLPIHKSICWGYF